MSWTSGSTSTRRTTPACRADLNAEGEGRWWSRLSNAADPSAIHLGAVLVVASHRFWSVVRIEQVDADGQVHFVGLAAEDPDVRRNP